MDQRKKGFKPPFIRNSSQAHQKGNPSQGDQKMTKSLGNRSLQQPIKCWECEGNYMYKYFPHQGDKMKTMHNIKQEETIEVGKSMPRIYVTLDNRQANYQSHMIEVEDNIDNQPIAILIYSRVIHSYIDPNIVENFKLNKCKHEKYWLVYLATRTKKRVNEIVKEFPINMNEINTKVDLKTIPLGSYDYLIGINWLEKKQVVLGFYMSQ
jgi:hypothetical protein